MFSNKPHTKVGMVEDPKDRPPNSIPRPWEDITLSAQKRYDSYKVVVEQKARDIVDAMSRPGITTEEQTAIRLNPDTQFWYQELKQLRTETPESFCERIDREVVIPKLFGQNFLGAAQWQQGFQVDVGVVPPIPKSITKELLESDCPLHPGEKIKDTHILMLVPKTVNGEPYSAVKLGELCAKRKGSGDRLIWDGSDGANDWKRESWVQTPQLKSEWVLIPKSDPDPKKVPPDKYFRSKSIAQQAEVHKCYAEDYREAKALEVMTAALLNDVVHGEPRMYGLNYLRCVEPNASGGRVLVGGFDASGLGVDVAYDDDDDDVVGGALAWKS
jgi:hypothetical protein